MSNRRSLESVFGSAQVALVLMVLAATARRVRRVVLRILTPRSATSSGVIRGLVGDLARSRAELLAENAFLRQQLLVASRQNKRPHLRPSDRTVLVLLASLLSRWRHLLVLVRPETLLRWHRDLFRRWWRFRSRRPRRVPPRRLPADTAALIRRMATDNLLWGAERIRGELLKVGIHACKRTIQRYIARSRSSPPTGQKWTTFIRNHLAQIWACDFVEVHDLWFAATTFSSPSTSAHVACSPP